MPDLVLEVLELIDANIADIKAKGEKEELSLKTCEEKTDKLEALKEKVISIWKNNELPKVNHN